MKNVYDMCNVAEGEGGGGEGAAAVNAEVVIAHLLRWGMLASVMRSQKVMSSVCSFGRAATEATPASVISRHKARFRLVNWVLFVNPVRPEANQKCSTISVKCKHAQVGLLEVLDMVKSRQVAAAVAAEGHLHNPQGLRTSHAQMC